MNKEEEMDKSLGRSVELPKHTKWVIQQSLKTKRGSGLVWIVVEAEDDSNLYEKFMDPETTSIRTSLGADRKEGYANVEKIVSEINLENPGALIFGIRDRDYTQFSHHTIPADVFITDERDMEMTLLADDEVRSCLVSWKPEFDTAFTKCEPICKYLGYVRIANEIHQLSIVFRSVGLAAKSMWDRNMNCIKTDWKADIDSSFFSVNDNICSDGDFRNFVAAHNLDKESTYKVCRGHDFIYLLAQMLTGGNKDILLQKMMSAYDYSRFSLSDLKKEIEVWATTKNVTVLNDNPSC